MKQYKNLLGVTLVPVLVPGLSLIKSFYWEIMRQEEISGVFGIRNIRSIS